MKVFLVFLSVHPKPAMKSDSLPAKKLPKVASGFHFKIVIAEANLSSSYYSVGFIARGFRLFLARAFGIYAFDNPL